MKRLVVVMALACAACPDYAPPLDAHIRCAAPDQCPVDWTCKPAIARCVPNDLDDGKGPTLSIRSIDPPTQRAGQSVTVAFVVDEPVAREPVLLLDGGEVEAGIVRNELAFSFTYDVTGDEAEGDHDVSTALVDRFGNEATPAIGTLTLDFTPPGSGAAAFVDDNVDTTATSLALESTGATLVCVEGDVAAPPIDCASTTRAGAYAPFANPFPLELAPGPGDKTVTVHFADDAGNIAPDPPTTTTHLN